MSTEFAFNNHKYGPIVKLDSFSIEGYLKALRDIPDDDWLNIFRFKLFNGLDNTRDISDDPIDHGGIMRQVFSDSLKHLFNKIFVVDGEIYPNFSYTNLIDDLVLFAKILGKALEQNVPLSIPLKKFHIVPFENIQDFDGISYLHKIIENFEEGDLSQSFVTFNVVMFGENIDLIENGENTPLNNLNRHFFIEKLIQAANNKLRYFRKVFHENFLLGFPISYIGCDEIVGLIQPKKIDLEDWRENTIHRDCSPEIVNWFWEILQEETDMAPRILSLVSGSPSPPHFGFAHMSGNGRIARFILRCHSDVSIESIPTCHSCYPSMHLPAYTSKDMMQTKLSQLIQYTLNDFNIQ